MNAERLFDPPPVERDDADPDKLKLAFAGAVELDRDNAQQVALYNRLAAGETHELVVTVYVNGARKVHQLDSEGDPGAVLEVKTLRVNEVYEEPVPLVVHGTGGAA